MSGADLFERLTIGQAARWLDLHPFDIVRLMGTEDGGLPADLRLDEAQIDRLRDLAGVETWWSGDLTVSDPVRGRALVRSLATQILTRADGSRTWVSRADNLYRGLEPADHWVIRRAVNQLILDGVLQSVPMASGLHVQVAPNGTGKLAGIADGSQIPASLEALWS